MKVCYIDESGGFEAEGSAPAATPLMVIVGLILDPDDVRGYTIDYLRLKRQFFPGKLSSTLHLLDYLLAEVKAIDIRRELRSSRRDDRRHAVGYLDKVVALLEHYGASIVGRIWVKQPGTGLDPAASYTYAIQDLARHFEHSLTDRGEKGLMICDSRLHAQNRQVSHSVFTMKHRSLGDSVLHIAESPVFGVSDNHAGLQLADLVAGALLFPMACRTYCHGCIAPQHMNPKYDAVKERYASRLRRLQYLYRDTAGRSRGGVVVSDRRANRPSRELFRVPYPVLVP